MQRCDRCRKETIGLSMSFFNTQMICMDCEAKERMHPKYAKAREREAEAVRDGNYNFPSIGLPNDL